MSIVIASQSSETEAQVLVEGLSLLHNFKFREATEFFKKKLDERRTLWNYLHYGEVSYTK